MIKSCIVVIISIWLAGLCGGQTVLRPQILRSVAPETRRNTQLEAAIRREVDETSWSYAYNLVALADGGAPDALVYLPGRDYCGSGGCTLLIFRSEGGAYRLLSRITLVRTPVIVSSHRTNGRKDLILFVAGGGIQPGSYAVLPFDGTTYADNPTVAPARPLKEKAAGVAYLAGAENPKSVIVVSPKVN